MLKEGGGVGFLCKLNDSITFYCSMLLNHQLAKIISLLSIVVHPAKKSLKVFLKEMLGPGEVYDRIYCYFREKR